MTDTSLTLRACVSLALFAAVLTLILFLGAGTWAWPQAWAFLAVFLGASAWTTVDLLRRDSGLVERRMASPTTEQRSMQRVLQSFNGLFFVALLLVPALDHRFGWSATPTGTALLGDVMVALGFVGIFQVYRANSFAASTVKVDTGQTVISTGPYAVVRHPMYASAIPLIAGVPLALGSWWGLIPVPLLMGTIVCRLLDEERMLVAELPGYASYRTQTRFRLIPGLF